MACGLGLKIHLLSFLNFGKKEVSLMQSDEIKPESLTYDELLQQNHALRQELEKKSAQEEYVWATLVETSRKLQLSSSSIKAAVSSLLNYDIFWDGANQHEFLETINTSIDQVSDLVKFVALESRLAARSLELKCEPHFLQEILSVVRSNLSRQAPRVMVSLHLPEDGKLVEVDYAYLILALELLIQVIASKSQENELVIIVEHIETNWTVLLEEVDTLVVEFIHMMACGKTHSDSLNLLPAEHILKLHIAFEIMKLQKIDFVFSEGNTKLGLLIPVFQK